jgi:hypothetical protein
VERDVRVDFCFCNLHAGYFPLVHGIEVDLRHVTVNSYAMTGGGGPAGNDPVLETEFEINPGTTNLLRAVVDTTGGTLTKQPLNLAATGGWFVCGQCDNNDHIEDDHDAADGHDAADDTGVSGVSGSGSIAGHGGGVCVECRNRSGVFSTSDALPKLATGAKETALGSVGAVPLLVRRV